MEESAENFRIAAEDVKRLETPIIPARDPNKKLFTFKEPIGTWAVITPWNFPTVIPSEYFGPGIAAGKHNRVQAGGADAAFRLIDGFVHPGSGFAARRLQRGDRSWSDDGRRTGVASRHRRNWGNRRDHHGRNDSTARRREENY